jgi:hypothetical protein
MTRAGAHVRSAERVREALTDAWALYHELRDCSVAQDLQELRDAFRNLDMSLAHALYLDSIAEYLARGGRSRGSCLVLDPSGELACEGLGDRWRYSLNLAGAFVDRHVLEISFTPDRDVVKEWAAVRPIPRTDTWFESVWKAYRDDEVIR